MIVDQFNIRRPLGCPDETEPELVVDPNGVLTFSICPQRFQAVAGRKTQVVQPISRVEHRQLTPNDGFEIRRKSLSRPLALKQQRAASILAANDRQARRSPPGYVSYSDTTNNI